MTGLDAQYVKDHLAAVHTPDSWARAVSEQTLHEAIKRMKGGSVPAVSLDAKLHITALKTQGCIQVCAEIGGVLVCMNINV